MVGNKIKMKIKINKKMNEESAVAAGNISGHVDNRRKLEESGITSDVSQNDSSGYVSEVTFDSITSGGRDYQVVQQLDILKTMDNPYIKRQNYPEIYKMVEECLPDSIKYVSYGKTMITYDINFKILYIEIDGQDIEFDMYDENIFSKMDSLKFFRHIMKEVGEYIIANPDKVYYFNGIRSDAEFRNNHTGESMRTKLYRMFLKRLFKMLPGDWRTVTLNDVNQVLFWKCPGKQAELVFENKETDFTDEEINLIHELYSTSGALMSSSGPYDRSKEGHKRYVRMRFINQGLQNFKPNRYFAENKNEGRKITIKIRKNLEEKCQKGYKTHEKRKTKKMFGKTYRNCVKAE